jgi:hypothetical protein
MAEVIFCVDLTLAMRTLRSLSDGMAGQYFPYLTITGA